MQKTQNYNLNKPELTDPIRVADFNENAEIIDAALNGLHTEAVTLAAQVRAEAANALAAYKTANDAAVAGKAEQSALDAYKTSNDAAVAAKAEQSALDAYKTSNDAAVAALNTAVAAGVKLQTGTYSGTGACGSGSKNTLTFSFVPKIVGIVVDAAGQTRGGAVFIAGQSKSSGISSCSSTGGTLSLNLTWSGNSVSWYTDNTGSANNQLNASGYTYRYFAFG